jgi:hypothetical protein
MTAAVGYDERAGPTDNHDGHDNHDAGELMSCIP